MKQLIKQWWNGRTIVIDDGGYVPRVVEQRPWVRTFYERNPAIVTTVATGITGAVCTEIVGRLTKVLLGG